MKVRIQPAQLLKLRQVSRPSCQIRFSSAAASSSTATPSHASQSRKPVPRARRYDGHDEMQDQYSALDSQLTSDASSPKPAHPKFTKRPVSDPQETPILKSNPYADTYRIEESDLEEVEMDEYEADETPETATRYEKEDSDILPERMPSDDLNDKPRHKKSHERSSAETRSTRNHLKPPGTKGSHHGRRFVMDSQEYRIQKGGITLIHDAERSSFISYIRLRDACPCPRCIDPSTRQKVHTSGDAYNEIANSIFADSVPSSARLRGGRTRKEYGLRIEWSSDHTAFFPLSRLLRLADTTPSLHRRLGNRGSKRFLWPDHTSLLSRSGSRLHVQYADLARKQDERDNLLWRTLRQLHGLGIVIIKGVPTDVSGNADNSLREVMGWIGEIRNTFYGETWNVRNVANSKNVAYTNLNLGLHMDLLYFQNPPRFQALHCLRNRVEGGSSYFVDSFAAAFDYLSDLPAKEAGKEAYPSIEFEYDNDGHYLYNIHHMIPKEKRYLDNVKTAVNWSPPFQGMPTQASVGNDPEAQLKWYKAVDKFQKILEQPQREWEFTMEEGDLVLFDNRRVLHARRAFRDLTEAEREERGVEVIEGESSRWLKGCYLDGEVVWDKLATLNRDVNGFSQ